MMARQLLVQGDKTFKVTIPDDAKVTFGPWSPPNANATAGYSTSYKALGTLRIYQGANVLGVFGGVSSFRDLSAIGYAEEVVREEGAVIWKDDDKGYMREDKVSRTKEWVEPTKQLAAKPARKRAQKSSGS
jgi:hypothetical protein